jgi:DNA-directed RNA polymerase III subunit RPC4
MSPKAAPRQQPRRNIKIEPAAESQASHGALDEEVIPEGDDDIQMLGNEPLNAPSPSLTDPEQPTRTSESLHPSRQLKRNRTAVEAPPDVTSAPSTAKPALRFQPRVDVVRRTKDELEAQKKLEEERRQERLAEAERDGATSSQRNRNAGGNNTRGRGGRSRGGSLRSDRSREGLASGPLGDGMAAPSGSTSKTTSSRGGRTSITTTVKKEPGISASTPRLRKPKQKDQSGVRSGSGTTKVREGGGLVESSSDEEDLGQRMDIQYISLISSDEDEDDDPIPNMDRTAGGRSFGRRASVKPEEANRPVRVDRLEHQKRYVGVNTDASSAISAEFQRVQEKTGETVDLSGALDAVNAGKSKDVEFVRNERRWRGVYEDDEEEHPTIKEEPDDVIDVDSAPVGLQDLEDDDGPTEEPSTQPKSRRRKRISFRESNTSLLTEEDREEWSRHEKDVETLTEELSMMHSGGAGMQDPENGSAAPRLYVFQFPALTPLLNTESSHESVHVANPNAIPIPIPGGREEKTPAIAAEAEEAGRAKSISAAKVELPGGFVGKLKIRQSGRVTLNWGGTSFELGRGTESHFLQDAIAVPREGDEEQRGSTSWALSQIAGKFIVTPDWEKILRE